MLTRGNPQAIICGWRAASRKKPDLGKLRLFTEKPKVDAEGVKAPRRGCPQLMRRRGRKASHGASQAFLLLRSPRHGRQGVAETFGKFRRSILFFNSFTAVCRRQRYIPMA
jgi:hypothetical protein